jgi:hypothetical protein
MNIADRALNDHASIQSSCMAVILLQFYVGTAWRLVIIFALRSLYPGNALSRPIDTWMLTDNTIVSHYSFIRLGFSNVFQPKFFMHLWFPLWMYKIQGIHKRMVRFQKLTRNLFLTLHVHNVHRHQRQLSQFLISFISLKHAGVSYVFKLLFFLLLCSFWSKYCESNIKVQ